jgi:hypothetical protein
MLPKEFIQKVFIGELGGMVNTHYYHYISFGVLGSGLEFISTCLDDDDDKWDTSYKDKSLFNNIFNLPSLQKYKNLVDVRGYDLKDNLRNGFAHCLAPKGRLDLLSKRSAEEKEFTHLVETNTSPRLMPIVCEILYQDFKGACELIIDKIENYGFKENSKMYKDFIYV